MEAKEGEREDGLLDRRLAARRAPLPPLSL